MILLDTNTLLVVLGLPARLGAITKKLISRADRLYFSPVSVFEIAVKQMLGKLHLTRPLPELIVESGLSPFPYRVEEALETVFLPSLVRHDPFDRMIVATAKARKASLLTSDRKLLDLGFDWILDSRS